MWCGFCGGGSETRSPIKTFSLLIDGRNFNYANIGLSGLENAYKIKLTVKQFGKHDPIFMPMVKKAMEKESMSVQKRFANNLS